MIARRTLYALAGGVLGLGAPAGLLLIRLMRRGLSVGSAIQEMRTYRRSTSTPPHRQAWRSRSRTNCVVGLRRQFAQNVRASEQDNYSEGRGDRARGSDRDGRARTLRDRHDALRIDGAAGGQASLVPGADAEELTPTATFLAGAGSLSASGPRTLRRPFNGPGPP